MCCGSRCIWRWRRCREAEEGRKEWIVLKCLLEMEKEKKEEAWVDSVNCWVRMDGS